MKIMAVNNNPYQSQNRPSFQMNMKFTEKGERVVGNVLSGVFERNKNNPSFMDNFLYNMKSFDLKKIILPYQEAVEKATKTLQPEGTLVADGISEVKSWRDLALRLTYHADGDTTKEGIYVGNLTAENLLPYKSLEAEPLEIAMKELLTTVGLKRRILTVPSWMVGGK